MKIKFVLSLVLISTFFGCSSDNGPAFNTADLIGKWHADGAKIGNNPVTMYLSPCSGKVSYKEFFEDGTINAVNYDGNCELVNDPTVYTWSIDNSVLTFNDLIPESQLSLQSVYSIVKLTATEMQLKQTVTNETESIIYIYYYSKL